MLPRCRNYTSGAVFSVILLVFKSIGFSDLYTWNSAGGAGTNWSSAANWNGGGPPGSSTGEQVWFNAINVNPNLDANETISNIIFTANAPALILKGGSTLTILNTSTIAIENLSSATETINFNITTSGASQEWGTDGGDLIIAGNITMGNSIQVGGNGNTTISGNISGNKNLNKRQGDFSNNLGTLTLSGNNTAFTGAVTLGTGTLIIDSSTALGSANTIIPGILNNAHNTTVLIKSAGITNNSPIILTNINTGVATIGGTNSSGTVVYTGNIDLGSPSGPHDITLTESSGGTVVFLGQLDENAAAVGSASVTKNNSGTVVLGASNAYNGATIISGGTLDITHAFGLGNTSSISVTGGTLLFHTGVTNTSATIAISGGTIQEIDQNVQLGALTLTANSSIQLNSGGTAGSLTFASGTNTVGAGAKLTIYGWNYNSVTDSGADDLIFFTNSSFETASFLNNITFFGLGGGARLLSTGELVPITPEPNTFYSGLLILGVLFQGFRNRFFLKNKNN
jgi:fibronectin-binding autotransporter adhesin